jgi:hypothetical protein
MASRLNKAARLLAGCAAIGGASFSFAVAADAGTGAHAYSGYAFDACSAPSIGALQAWSASPFRALNVYVGGSDRACGQPNLSAGWVRTVINMGWRLIPTYVSLQAPHPSCRCASMNPNLANSEGVAAATDAVQDARDVGIGRGNPIYDDMEGYSATSVNIKAVMDFLEGWTGRLHGLGYTSGVYSSANSGIANLVWRVGRGFIEPNDIWIADWNGQATTNDPYVPVHDWNHNQRIHQYRGPHTDNYGGVKINIDSDFCRAAVVAPGTLGPLGA